VGETEQETDDGEQSGHSARGFQPAMPAAQNKRTLQSGPANEPDGFEQKGAKIAKVSLSASRSSRASAQKVWREPESWQRTSIAPGATG
jgi:hypothetical protein